MLPNFITTLSRWIHCRIDGVAPLEKISEPSYRVSDSTYRSASDSITGEAQALVTQVKNQLTQALARPDAKTLEKLAELNRKRQAKGQNLLDLQKVNQHLEMLCNDSCLSAKDKKKKIETLRKTLGISKNEMKELFTKRLEGLYKMAEKSLASYQQSKTRQLETEKKQTEQAHGKNSPQVQAVEGKLSNLKASLEPERNRLSERGNFYHSLYPGFWSKLGGFFKKLGSGFTKVLGTLGVALRFLPGVGPLAARVLGSVKYLFQGFRLDKLFANLGRGVFDTLKNWKTLLPLIPGVGSIVGIAAQGIEAILKKTRGGTQLLK